MRKFLTNRKFLLDNKWTSSLRTRISAVVISLMALIMIMTTGYSFWNQSREIKTQAMDKATSTAQLLSGLSEFALLSLDYTLLDPILQKTMKQPDVLYVRVKDADGKTVREQKKKTPAKHFIEVNEPVIIAGTPSGYVTIRLSTDKSYARLMKDARIALLQMALGLTLSAALLLFLLNRIVIKRIDLLNSKAHQIASGDLTVRAGIRGNDEIASLNASLNTISDSFKQMLGKIKNINGIISEVSHQVDESSRVVVAGVEDQKSSLAEAGNTLMELNESASTVYAATEGLSTASQETSASIAQLTGAISTIAESAEVFDAAASETVSSIEQMITGINQISEGLETHSSSSESIASSVEEVNVTIKDIEKSAVESAALAESLLQTASQRGMQTAETAIRGIDNIKNSVADISEAVNALGVKSEEIGSVVTVIDGVADQTGLLALNAAILAAQAGSYGDSFAVVANEIKGLAERTAHSTKEISLLIKSVQEMVSSSVEKAAEGIQSVNTGLAHVREVHNALQNIVKSSNASTEMARVIRKATAEESVVVKQISETIRNMTEQTEKISRALQEQTRGSQLIIEATGRIKDLSAQVKSAANDQKGGSVQISVAAESVAGQSVQIAHFTERQQKMSVELAGHMQKVNGMADSLVLSVKDMAGSVNSLKEQASNLSAELQKFKI
ncbi:MAG: methyl-accepting chemotaxis protein [Nitrospiraceae bacterium]|nr:methyl-accepting chemotaxis protein [Nitrospiraceae bacterium]